MLKNEKAKPNNKAKRDMENSRMENRLKTKRRKTIATNDRTIYDLDSDKPNQKDRNNKKIITRVE